MKRKQVEDGLVMLGIVGSHAYGTNIEGSDIDLKGITIPPIEYFLSTKTFSQKDKWDSGDEGRIPELEDHRDITVYSISKFMELVVNQNPNILDLLWLPESCVLRKTAIYDELLIYREYLLSKKAHASFSGYAHAQIMKMEKHRLWLQYERDGLALPPPNVNGMMTDDGILGPLHTKSELFAFYEFLVVMLKDKYQYFNEYPELVRLGNQIDWSGLLKQNALPDEALSYVQTVTKCSDNYLSVLNKTQQYLAECKRYDSWIAWKANRNPERAALELKCGFDCHVDSTEYLTLRGFKRYEDITESDLLGTYDTVTGELEFQPYINRFSYDAVDIDIHEINTYKTGLAVTGNHRLWIQPVTRRSSTNYKPIKSGEWQFTTAEELPNEFNYVTGFENNNEDYDISDEKLKLIGIYVSEGYVNYATSRKGVTGPKAIRIEQEVSGKANSLFTLEFCDYWNVKTYRYTKRNGTYDGFIYVIHNRELAEEMELLCGRYSKNKHLPDFVYLLSKRQIEVLLYSMYLGDGTRVQNGATVYYTTSPLLADQAQILSTLCGKFSYVTAYNKEDCYKPHRMYHVYISHQHNSGYVHTRKGGSSSVVKYTGKVNCFETANHTLITRLKGKIAVHGNSKNASHCLRLQLMLIEILRDGVINVRRTEDADYLRAVRNGQISYEEVMSLSNQLKDEAAEALKLTSLPNIVDKDFVDNILTGILSNHFRFTR